MDDQRQNDQLEPIYNSAVSIQGVALKTYWERWTIEKGSGRGPGRSVLRRDMMMMMIAISIAFILISLAFKCI